MVRIRKLIYIFLLLFILFSCVSCNKKEIDYSNNHIYTNDFLEEHYYSKNIQDTKEENFAIKQRNEAIAFYVDDGDGNYSQVTDAPTTGYTLNEDLTHCIGGGEISFNSSTGTITYNITGQDKCYVYFEKSTSAFVQ